MPWRRAAIDGVELVPATEEISNADEPVAAVRSRPDASVVMAARDVAEGRSDAIASAGSTGATMTAALFALRRMQGVRRPALAVQLVVPGESGPPTLLLDVGANAEARAVDLVQFAFLGAAFSKAVLGVAEPRVALLSVGEEAKKGSNEVIEAHARLGAASGPGIDFQGNLEGRDLLGGQGRRDRHRRVHRQRRPEDDRGNGGGGRRRGPRRRPLRHPGGRRRAPAAPCARRAAPPDGPRRDGRGDPPGVARRWRWSVTAAPAPTGSQMRSVWPPARSRSGPWSGRPICSRSQG